MNVYLVTSIFWAEPEPVSPSMLRCINSLLCMTYVHDELVSKAAQQYQFNSNFRCTHAPKASHKGPDFLLTMSHLCDPGDNELMTEVSHLVNAPHGAVLFPLVLQLVLPPLPSSSLFHLFLSTLDFLICCFCSPMFSQFFFFTLLFPHKCALAPMPPPRMCGAGPMK